MLEIVIVAAALLLDQLTKHWAQTALTQLPGNTMPLIEDVFHLTYIENRGAAFSILQGKRSFFLVITVIMVAGLTWYLLRNRKHMGRWTRVGIALLIAGGLGNGIDRLLFGYVRDLFDFRLIQFPVFNIADAALTAAVIMLAIYILFLDKGEKSDPKDGEEIHKEEKREGETEEDA